MHGLTFVAGINYSLKSAAVTADDISVGSNGLKGECAKMLKVMENYDKDALSCKKKLTRWGKIATNIGRMEQALETGHLPF